jgi:hypothetical protein
MSDDLLFVPGAGVGLGEGVSATASADAAAAVPSAGAGAGTGDKGVTGGVGDALDLWLGLEAAADVCDLDLLLHNWDQELLQEEQQGAVP